MIWLHSTYYINLQLEMTSGIHWVDHKVVNMEVYHSFSEERVIDH